MQLYPVTIIPNVNVVPLERLPNEIEVMLASNSWAAKRDHVLRPPNVVELSGVEDLELAVCCLPLSEDSKPGMFESMVVKIDGTYCCIDPMKDRREIADTLKERFLVTYVRFDTDTKKPPIARLSSTPDRILPFLALNLLNLIGCDTLVVQTRTQSFEAKRGDGIEDIFEKYNNTVQSDFRSAFTDGTSI